MEEACCSACGCGLELSNCKQSGRSSVRRRLVRKPKCRMRTKPCGKMCSKKRRKNVSTGRVLSFCCVVAYGMRREVTKLEFFQHCFAKMGHGNTSCDPHLYPSHQATNAPLPHAKRPPRSGYVLTELPVKVVILTHFMTPPDGACTLVCSIFRRSSS